MAKRVYEIARDRGLQPQQVLRRLRAAGINVTSTSSAVEESDIERVFNPPNKSNTLPWLNKAGPKTVKKEDIEKETKERQDRIDRNQATKSRAMEQAKLIKAKRAADQQAKLEAEQKQAEAVEKEQAKQAQIEADKKQETNEVSAVKEEIAKPISASVAPKEQSAKAPPTEMELRRRAQELARQRVSEQAAQRRATVDRETLEAKEREKAEAKKKGAAPSRKMRETTSNPNQRRRVVIDSNAGKPQRSPSKQKPQGPPTVKVQKPQGPIRVEMGVTVKELADKLLLPASVVIKELIEAGDLVPITQTLTRDQIDIVSLGLGREIEIEADINEIPIFEDQEADLTPRSPIVTIMGHVDHGKTTLLDAIRNAKVAQGEAGGITQHIGAYQAKMSDGRSVTFLDTPGHEAFTALRARGAKVTDVAVLVVAADDGVRPQTLEAISHAKAAGVPIVVAINKIDKDNANPDKVKTELAEHDLAPEEWGGQTVTVEVSAKQEKNLDELIELLLLQADILELKANPNAMASGYIIESKLDPGRGPVATFLINRGTLKVGDIVLAGSSYGKVRALLDWQGNKVTTASLAMPVEVIGFNTVPASGEFCQVVADERTAKQQAAARSFKEKKAALAKKQVRVSLEDFFSRAQTGEIRDLNLIVKADVGGSLEAIEMELSKIQHPEVGVRIIHSGIGGITKSDIDLASASNAIVIGFNVRPNLDALDNAKIEGVEIQTYRIIYKLKEDIENALTGLLAPEEYEETMGQATVRQLFRSSKFGTIAGCMVTNGQISRTANIRIIRQGAIVHEGLINSLQRAKEQVQNVAMGFECGIVVENFNDIKEDDVIEFYENKQRARTL